MYDRIVAVLCLIIAAMILIFGIEMGGLVFHNPGPGFMPVLAAGLIALFSLLILLRKRKKEENKRPFQGVTPHRIVLTCGFLFAYSFMLPWAGYLLTTFLVMISLLHLVKKYPLPYVLGLSAVTACVSFLIFNTWLEVSLPKGFWGF